MAFLVGLDLGQMQDYTALALIEREQGDARHPNEVRAEDRRALVELRATPSPACYTVRHLQRFAIGTSYPDLVGWVAALLQRPELAGRSVTLVFDITAVGGGIVGMFKAAQVYPKTVSLHGGQATTLQGAEYHVSKRDVVYYLTALAQSRPVRLALGDRLPFAAEVKGEMQTFTAKLHQETAHESFAAWREQAHDDLLLALALCTWWGETQGNQRAWTIPVRY